MKTIVNNSSAHSRLGKKTLFWLSFLVFGISNDIAQVEMVKHLSKDGGDVYLFAMAPKREGRRISNAHLIIFPLKFVPIITPLLYTLALFVCMPFYIIFKNPDYIITDEWTTTIGFALKLFLRKIKARFVLDIRSTPITAKGTSFKYWSRVNAFRARLNDLFFRISVILAKERFDGITILTESMKEHICNEFNINPEFAGVWTSGVSAELFNPENFDRIEIRKSLGLEDRFVIFYHGALGKLRGVDEVIKSMRKLRDQFDDLVLFILGDGSYKFGLKRLAEETATQDKVIFHNKVPYEEVPKYIAMSDVGIVPLPDLAVWRYQCPLKLIEYLAMKKVVIATNIPANREIIGEGKCGIYMSSNDLDEIAKAIAFVHNNRDKLSEWGSIGRNIVEGKYTWEKIAENFENYLLSL